MAQQNGSYNQFGQYGQVPGQPQQSFPRFGGGQGGGGYGQGQYPQGTFQQRQGGQQPAAAGTNTSDLSTTPPTGDASTPSAAPSTSTTPTTSTPAPPPVTSGAAGQQAPETNHQYPQGTFPGLTPMYGGSLGQSSTGPVNMVLGNQGAAGAWDGGYNPFYAPAQQTPAPPPTSAPAAQAAPMPQTPTPAPAGPPPAAPTGVTWGSPQMLDYLRQYGPGTTGLGQDQVNALLGGPSAPASAGTVAYNAAQQQFTGNNQGYAGSGYWGNAAQVAAQQAEHAQANSIPLGVLGASFGVGGADYGGQQNGGNSMNGLNGARDWNGSTYGLPYPTGTFR